MLARYGEGVRNQNIKQVGSPTLELGQAFKSNSSHPHFQQAFSETFFFEFDHPMLDRQGYPTNQQREIRNEKKHFPMDETLEPECEWQ